MDAIGHLTENHYLCSRKTLFFEIVKIQDVVTTLERFAPLPLQESYDNAGLQVGLTAAEVSGVLLCLDVTEAVIDEAVRLDCNLVVAHHPLLFRPLRRVGGDTQAERCVRLAVRHDVAVYAAHTNLDNQLGGVNDEMARRLGLSHVVRLQPHPQGGGAGVMGKLEEPMSAQSFLALAKEVFGVACLQHNQLLNREVRMVGLCGGAGDFLLPEAVAQGCDAFLTGEMHYHQYFGYENVIQIGVLGHYQSEQFTPHLMQRILHAEWPDLRTHVTSVATNPIHYM